METIGFKKPGKRFERMFCKTLHGQSEFTQGEVASCKSALKPQVVYSTDRSKAVVPVLVLLFGALWFILRGDLLYVLPCGILFLCFFSPFSIAITSLGEERANLSAFRTFDRFVLVWICRFPLPLGVWEGLRFVIVSRSKNNLFIVVSKIAAMHCFITAWA